MYISYIYNVPYTYCTLSCAPCLTENRILGGGTPNRRNWNCPGPTVGNAGICTPGIRIPANCYIQSLEDWGIPGTLIYHLVHRLLSP